MAEPKTRWGASEAAWEHFSKMGLTADMLPVVSNPHATISANSKMAAVGKTPSRYNSKRLASGIQEWTTKRSIIDEIAKWATEPDYGICLQTRVVRALDGDITDPGLADKIAAVITQHFGVLPRRQRDNSPKFLVAFTLQGEHYKRTIKTSAGIIEFLATGQQFVAAGTHTSGSRYKWKGALPAKFPEVTPLQFEALWADLEKQFAVEPSTEARAPTKAAQLKAAALADPIAIRLQELSLILSQTKEGQLNIICPFADGHSSQTAESSTAYWPAHTGGYMNGHFHCLHASCNDRTDQDFAEKIGFSLADEFEDLGPEEPEMLASAAGTPPAASLDLPTNAAGEPVRFKFVHASTFASTKPARYIIKGVIPEAELVVIYGASTSGKTFAVLDMAAAIARGEPWRGLRVHGGRVAYIVAEGANFFRGRLTAYAQHFDVPIETIDLHILGSAPNLLSRTDSADLIDGLRQLGPLKLIVIDTLAQTMAGGDENGGADMGKVLSHCKAIHRHTGATILLVHHSGKDETKGARGWSGLRAACDAELEVIRGDVLRKIRVSKQKDGKDGVEYGFRLKTVPIGIDEDDDIIESCIVDHTDQADDTGVRPTRQLKGAVETAMYEHVKNSVSPGGAGISVGTLIDHCVSQMPYDETATKRDQRRRNAMRALDSLRAAHYVVLDAESNVNIPQGLH